MAQAESRRTLTMDARIQSQASPCEIRGEQSGTRTAVSPSTSMLPCQHHSNGVPTNAISQQLTAKLTHLNTHVLVKTLYYPTDAQIYNS